MPFNISDNLNVLPFSSSYGVTIICTWSGITTTA